MCFVSPIIFIPCPFSASTVFLYHTIIMIFQQYVIIQIRSIALTIFSIERLFVFRNYKILYIYSASTQQLYVADNYNTKQSPESGSSYYYRSYFLLAKQIQDNSRTLQTVTAVFHVMLYLYVFYDSFMKIRHFFCFVQKGRLYLKPPKFI